MKSGSTRNDLSYASESFWEERYKEGEIVHEWYYSFDLLQPIIQKTLSSISISRSSSLENNVILEIGCGDKPLVPYFANFGISCDHLLCIDFSPTVISQLSEKKEFKEKCKFLHMDARRLDFSDQFFTFIVDKGTMDAMLSEKKKEKGFKNAKEMLTETIRVLQNDSALMIVSHVEVDSDDFDEVMQNVIIPSLSTRSTVNWSIEAHVVEDSNNDGDDAGYGTVYMISSRSRRVTRSSSNTSSTGQVSFKVLRYDV